MSDDNIIEFPNNHEKSKRDFIKILEELSVMDCEVYTVDVPYDIDDDVNISFDFEDGLFSTISVNNNALYQNNHGPILELEAILLEIKAYGQQNPDVIPFITQYLKRFHKNL